MIGFALALLVASTSPIIEACPLPTGWTGIAAKQPRFVVFGEVHGTRESPQLVGRLACALSQRGERILVGVELHAGDDPVLQRLWATPDAGFGGRVLDQLPHFADRRDGVASKAMLDLLVGLHALKEEGRRIDIVAFNGSRGDGQSLKWRALPGQGPHEAMQAENIATAAAAKPYDRVLVLVGNLHARKLPVESQGFNFQPMAMHLSRSGRLVSLEETFGSGTAWNCINRDCAVHGGSSFGTRQAAEMGFWSSPQTGNDAAYDGYYWFDVVHASPPAGSKQDK